jgi:hypothetical protein
MGYILVKDNSDFTRVFYYRHEKYYESFNAWFIDQMDWDGDLSYAPAPFPLDDMLPPDSPEALWYAKFKARVWDAYASACHWAPHRVCRECGVLEDLSGGPGAPGFSNSVESMCEACVEDCVLGYLDYPVSSQVVHK